ncbi:ABC transporter permease [Vibrio splendidus]|uniref:ABC transporter permease n=1 Tax=Vibrio splendidus TaxID=29497 RepID=UPI0015CF9901|nr:ABC transporter permease [Vibrio splendidus]
MSQNRLNYLWLVIEPLLFMMVYYVVFGIFLKKGTDNFAAYLLTGLVPWLWFQRAVSRSSLSIVKGKGLSSQIAISKSFFVFVTCTQEAFQQCVSFLLLFSMLIFSGYFPDFHWSWVILLLGVQMLFVSACSLISAYITTFFRDFNMLIPSGMRVLMYISGVVYPISKIPEEYHWFFDYNPIAILVNMYRDVLIFKSSPSFMSMLILSLTSTALILFTFLLFKNNDEKLTREIMR